MILLNKLTRPDFNPMLLRVNERIGLVLATDGLLVDLIGKTNTPGNLWLNDCRELTHLPAGLRVNGNLYVGNCPRLTYLPDGLYAQGSLDLTNCTALVCLPNRLYIGGDLDVSGCTALTELPDDLHVGGNVFARRCDLLRLPTNTPRRSPGWRVFR